MTKTINETITEAFSSSHLNPQSSLQSRNHTDNNSTHTITLSQQPQSLASSNIKNVWQPEPGLIPAFDKFNGNTDILEYIKDLETRFLLLPNLSSTDRLKVIIAVENLTGSRENQTDAPKQWARVELRFDENLRDDWPAFREKLRSRYQNVELRKRLVEERQALKQLSLTIQAYKQSFEQLCYQT
ncbi:hypothetical protein EV44_g5919 [Erysiphe necator]|uniref:Retrotransposon gag domain-containing protein n=1 Tax=Uncinula necator TaxID=52586 RepID=A0A0B1P218_UNCNE|nr:hypothetical protein EV44_g5919 [Erysiphe necator]